MMDVRRLIPPLALILASALSAQVPPQAVPILKKVGTDLVEKVLKPKMQVESFTLGGFRATEVDCDGDATPEAFSGTATFALPAPLGPRKLAFKGLVLKGALAEGSFEEPLKDVSVEHQHWTYVPTKVLLSDKGSRVEGTATLAGLKLDIAPLALTAQGLQGTLAPGDLPLAEGFFTATLLGGEVTFAPQGVTLKGTLDITLTPQVRHGGTGAEVHLEGGIVTFDSALLVGSGTVAPALATDLPLRHKGNTWIVVKEAFGFERGTPILGGPTRLQFPLNVFCRVGATDQPYLTDALTCHIRARVPAPAPPKPSGGRPSNLRQAPDPALSKVEVAWEGFSGSFPLIAAALHPSGLTTYRVDVEKGVLRVEKGQLDAAGTRVTGHVAWGPGFAYETAFADAPAALEDGLYVKGSPLAVPAEVGAYRVHTYFASPFCDFSTAHSPEGLPEGWVGVYLPTYQLALPAELFTLGGAGKRLPVLAAGKAGRFEGNATFSGSLGVKLTKRVNLYFAPVDLAPFELHFREGALLSGPVVQGSLHLDAPPLLDEDTFSPALSLHFTQNGVEQVEVHTQTPKGPMATETSLTGITMVLESARLYPTLFDMSGRFDFAIEGADIPSVAFDHLALEASGGPLEGAEGDIKLEFKGQRWSQLPDRPNITLWGFPFALSETGYGVSADRRFYVGLGGDIEANPLVPTLYNRLHFTTATGTPDQPTVELELPYTVKQDLASLGSLDGSMGFHVETAGKTVSEAYFLGSADLKVNLGDAPFNLQAGLRFGRSYQGGTSFPYFCALGHFQAPKGGVPVAPNFEIYGLVGGLAQNYLPNEIRNTTDMEGTPDSSLGLAILAGVDAGTTDSFTLDAQLDLYVSQNLTTVLQGKGWLFGGRGTQPPDRQVTADLRFTRKPDTFHATLDADLNLYGGILRPMGRVELHFAPDQQYIHLGTKDAPVTVRFLNSWEGWGYLTADWQGGTQTYRAGGGVTYSKGGSFGIVYGEAWLTAQGDLVLEIDPEWNPYFYGTVGAEGGASFGMKFKTYKTHKITIFSGSLGTNLAFQAPGSPTFSGSVTLRYRVLGGLFKGSVSAHLDI